MLILIKLLGIIIIAFGIIYLVNPGVMRKYIMFWAKGSRIYIGGVLNILISIILLLAASRCKLVWFVILVGLASLAEGIILLMSGPKKWVSMINWWAGRPSGVLRILGLLVLAIGVALLYSV